MMEPRQLTTALYNFPIDAATSMPNTTSIALRTPMSDFNYRNFDLQATKMCASSGANLQAQNTLSDLAYPQIGTNVTDQSAQQQPAQISSPSPRAIIEPKKQSVDTKRHTKEKRSFTCEVCAKTFTQKNALIRHERIHTGEKRHACPHCDKAFARQDKFKEHVRRHANEKRFGKVGGADGPTATASMEMEVYTHESLTALDMPSLSPMPSPMPTNNNFDNSLHTRTLLQICETRLDVQNSYSQPAYKSKDAVAQGSLPVKTSAKVEETSTQNNHESPTETSAGLDMPSLDPLPSPMPNNSEFEIPVAEKPKTKRRKRIKCQCPYCSAEGGNNTKGINGQHLHVCHIAECGKVFAAAKSLRRHLECHEGKENFSCQYCDKGFVHQDTLKKHVRRHEIENTSIGINEEPVGQITEDSLQATPENDESKITCPIAGCKTVFKFIRNLNPHLIEQHGLEPYACTFCNEKFKYRDDFQQHMKTHAVVINIFCPYCHKRCIDRSTLNRHVYLVHTNSNSSKTERRKW